MAARRWETGLALIRRTICPGMNFSFGVGSALRRTEVDTIKGADLTAAVMFSPSLEISVYTV
jgi:hypothetical protein